MTQHALADYVRILARGKNASRNMTFEEARFTMGEMLAGRYEDVQLGAIFMLLRVLEETPDEIAGFASAVNEYWPEPAGHFDLVWSSYAGKRRQPMWWVLSALLLGQMGHRILVHGTLAHTLGRVYAHEVFQELGLPTATRDSLGTITAPLVYLPCSEVHPTLQQWLSLKSVLGVRSPINTVLKTIAPAGVPSVQGIFHPDYRTTHSMAASINQDTAAIIKGEGGEFEVNPERPCQVTVVVEGEEAQFRIANDSSHYDDKAASPNTEHLIKLWQGQDHSQYGHDAVLRTAALALCAMLKSTDYVSALSQCSKAWAERDKSLLA